MKFDVLTLFPEMFEPMKQSIIGRAIEKELLEINFINIRDFSKDKHKKVDDTIYGGGAGMLINQSVKSEKSKVIYLSPQGKTLCQSKVEELAREKHLILLCGHYEGIDQRIIDKIVDEEISIGDYVLTGGEIPAMVLIDSVSRYIEGVINFESTSEESFSKGLLEYPQYTRPENFLGMQVPEILKSGHHENIEKWRRKEAIKTTYIKRPELLKKAKLTDEEIEYVKELRNKKD